MNMPWLVIVAVALAGCSTGAPELDPDPVAPEPVEEPAQPEVEEVETSVMSVFDCEGQVIYVPVDWDAAAAALPADLEPISFGSSLGAGDDPATATAYSLIYHCQTISGPAWNATDVGIGMWGFAAQSNVHFPAGTGFTWHAFVIDDAMVSQSLQDAGVPVVLGDASYQIDSTHETQATSTMSGGGASMTVDTLNLEPDFVKDAWTVRFLFVDDQEIQGGADIDVESLVGASSYGTLTGNAPGMAGPGTVGVGIQAMWDGLAQTFTWLEVEA